MVWYKNPEARIYQPPAPVLDSSYIAIHCYNLQLMDIKCIASYTSLQCK